VNDGLVIALVGAGVAGFLWYRSQQAQAAALAAAAANPGPGFVGKLENTVKKYGGIALNTVEQVPKAGFRAATGVVGSIAGGAASVVSSIGGLF
jgi:hypothetical protein